MSLCSLFPPHLAEHRFKGHDNKEEPERIYACSSFWASLFFHDEWIEISLGSLPLLFWKLCLPMSERCGKMSPSSGRARSLARSLRKESICVWVIWSTYSSTHPFFFHGKCDYVPEKSDAKIAPTLENLRGYKMAFCEEMSTRFIDRVAMQKSSLEKEFGFCLLISRYRPRLTVEVASLCGSRVVTYFRGNDGGLCVYLIRTCFWILKERVWKLIICGGSIKLILLEMK